MNEDEIIVSEEIEPTETDPEWVNNTLIPDEVLDEYNIYKGFPDKVIGIYQTFLIATDYVPAKMMEAQLGGYELDKDYTSILQYRQTARTEINRLREESNAD